MTKAAGTRSVLETALDAFEGRERAWVRFLVNGMPPRDLESIDAAYLIENVRHASLVRDEVPTGMRVPEAVFLEHVLPYAFVDEQRDPWRPLFFDLFAEPARRAASIEDAVRFLNREVYEALDVTYHPTKRPQDNMSPFESMGWRFASCTGLSILLAGACRAVGIPARLVGTPAWLDGTGNHTWVEIWDHGTWHFLGASEPGDYDRAWFNDAARLAAGAEGSGIFATRWSKTAIHFPLAWNSACEDVPADDVSAPYAEIHPTPEPVTRIVTEPRRYVAPRLEAAPTRTGRIDDPAWRDVPWTEAFVDIEGHKKPPPRFRTRAKIAWDDAGLYIAAELEDPHVFATLTEKNSIIFNDPDFEVFIDPDGDNHHYYELEVNALGTIWELYLERPYRDGGPIHRGRNLEGVVCRVHVDGTLNDPTDLDRGWSVEIAIPWASLRPFARGAACPPEPGDVWRMNFSRVHWLLDVMGDGYEKVPREAHPEDNWVWTPQEAIDMHRPERWGYVTFASEAPGRQREDAAADPTWPARERLMLVYAQQKARGEPSFDPADFDLPGVVPDGIGPLRIETAPGGWTASLECRSAEGARRRVAVDHEGRLTVS